MDIDQGKNTNPMSKELRTLTFVLLVYAIYLLIFDLYRLIGEVFSPTFVGPWPVIFIPKLSTVVIFILAGISNTWIKKRQSRGWWLAGVLFTSWLFAGVIASLVMILQRFPPDDLPLYTMRPLAFIRVLVFLPVGLWGAVTLSRISLMNELTVGAENRKKKICLMFLYGFLLNIFMTIFSGALMALLSD